MERRDPKRDALSLFSWKGGNSNTSQLVLCYFSIYLRNAFPSLSNK